MISRILFCIILILSTSQVDGQIITTVAGGGSGGDGSLATAASINNPGFLAFDKEGNLYFSESAGHRIRKISTAGILTTIAGNGTPGFSGDGGNSTAAKVNQPAGVAIDTVGNIFFVDGANHRLRKITAITGVIITVAGGAAGFSGDGGPAAAAQFYLPGNIWFDRNGELYITDDGNLRLRKISLSGVISTVAGNGLAGWGGNGGLALSTRCYPYGGIAKDGMGNLFFAEWTWGVIRKINNSGIITTIAGDTSSHLYNGDEIPATSARLDPFHIVINKVGEMFIADTYNSRIRKIDASGIIHTVAGNGVAGNSGDNALAILATIHSPSGLALDTCGNLYFTQANIPRIRKIAFNPDCLPISVQDVICSEALTITLHPNPATETLTITAGVEIESVSVMNALGQMVTSPRPSLPTKVGTGKEREVLLDIHFLPPGVYMVRVNEVWVGKMVKQ